MNTQAPQMNIGATQPDPNSTPPLHPALIRGWEITKSLTIGAVGGYLGYWGTRFAIWMKWLEGAGTINPIPYVLSGVISAALVETARLTYDAAMAILGNSERFANDQEATTAFE